MLAGMTGAFSQTHVDGAGYNTFVHVLTGSKKWVVARDWPCHPQWNGWMERYMAWEPVHLQAGDDL